MLFVRWQGLRTQLNMCNPMESKGGFRLFAGGLNGGTAAYQGILLAHGGILGRASETTAVGGRTLSGTGIEREESLFARARLACTPAPWFKPARQFISLISGFRSDKKGIGTDEPAALLRDRAFYGKDSSIGTRDTGEQSLPHALFKTLNIRDRQSHVRRLCHNASNG